MRRGLTAVVALAILAGCGGKSEVAMANFMIKSDAFSDDEQLPKEFTCDGADQSPPLEWSEPPSGTKSFALIVDDPDAPNGTFSHWAAYNIPPNTHGIEAGQGGQFAQAVNDFGKQDYGGPCPPPGHGVHHYRFKLFALDVDRLDVPSDANVRDVEIEAKNHLLDRTELTGTYERK